MHLFSTLALLANGYIFNLEAIVKAGNLAVPFIDDNVYHHQTHRPGCWKYTSVNIETLSRKRLYIRQGRDEYFRSVNSDNTNEK
jgi:hypothetical protein